MTKKQTRQKRRPDLHAFHAPDRDNAYWTRIGAAWAHEDGAGYTLLLELMPMDGRRIVLRNADEAETEAGDEEGA